MKSIALAVLLSTGFCHAAFETWTSKDGRTAELNLIKVTETGGEKSGAFKTKDGTSVNIKVSQLADADAAKLAAWKDPNAKPVALPSKFDELLDGNLVKLQNDSLKSYVLAAKPTKYYLFYYTASWCGPCHRFTPSLVEFYNTRKPKSDAFEVVLITSDQSEDAMEKYAKEMKMPWPQLKLSKTNSFKQSTKLGGSGIPCLVLTDLDGKVIKHSYEGGKYIGPTPVMNELGKLLTTP